MFPIDGVVVCQKKNIISHDLAFLEGNKKTKSVTNIDFMKLDVGHISSSEGF